MRILILILLLAGLSSPVHAVVEDVNLHALLPYEPPAQLNKLGRDLWMTLVNGKPRIKNWKFLMGQNPSFPGEQEALQDVLRIIEERLGAIGPQLYNQAATRVFRRIEASKQFEPVRHRLQDPLPEILASFDRTFGGRQEKERPYAEAHRLALAQIERHLPRGASQNFDDQERRQLGILTWRYMNQTRFEPTTADARRFEQWRDRWVRELRSRVQKAWVEVVWKMTVAMNSSEEMRLIHFDQPGGRESTLDELPGDTKMVDLVHPIDLTKAEQEKVVLTGSGVNNALVYVRHLRMGLMAVKLGQDAYSKWSNSSGPNLYDYEAGDGIEAPGGLRKGSVALDMARAYERRTSFQNIVWSGARTRSSIEQHFKLSAEGRGGLGPDWMLNAFRREPKGSDVDHAFQILARSRQSLYGWQIMTKGFEFWDESDRRASSSTLRTVSLGRQQDEFAIDPKAMSLLVDDQIRGNHEILDPTAKTKLFFVITGDSLNQRRVWRLPDVADALRLRPYAGHLGKPRSLRIRQVSARMTARTRNDEGLDVLLIPTPSGLAPDLTQSRVTVEDESGSRVLGLKQMTLLRYHRYWGVALREVSPNATIAATYAYREWSPDLGTLSWPRSLWRKYINPRPIPLQARKVAEFLNRAGSLHFAKLVDGLERLDARDLAKLLPQYAIYEFRHRAEVPGDFYFKAFVDQDQKFHVQCAMAFKILAALIREGLNEEGNARLELRKATTLSENYLGDEIYLTTPAHAQLDVYDGEDLVVTLDATPSGVPNPQAQTASGEVMRGNREAVWEASGERQLRLQRALDHFDRLIQSANVIPAGPLHPLLKIRRAVRLFSSRYESDNGSDFERTKAFKVLLDLDDSMTSADIETQLGTILEKWLADANRLRHFASESLSERERRESGLGAFSGLTLIDAARDLVGATKDVLRYDCSTLLIQ